MKVVIFIYYLLYILSGGFRHFGVDYIFWNDIQGNIVTSVPLVLIVFEKVMLAYGLIILFMPKKSIHHLIFGLSLFVMDVFFQNSISYISSFILPHLFPFFFFFYLRFNDSYKKRFVLGYIAMLLVSVGYISSFYAKFQSGWLRWDSLVLQDYIFEFNYAFNISTLLGKELLTIQSHLFWKIMDWGVLMFQLSFILVFFDKKYFYKLSFLSIIFHVAILLTMGIGVFYLYILFYAFIYLCTSKKEQYIALDNLCFTVLYRLFERLRIVLGVALSLIFVFNMFEPHFFNKLLPLPMFEVVEYFYNAICIFVFTFIFYGLNGSTHRELTKTIEHGDYNKPGLE